MSEILFENVQMVEVSKLKPYDKNPRKGNVRAIAESLSVNKQYRPIVVQKSTNKILAGNHTWQAAQSLGWKEISVVFVDVDEESASKIVLADNRTSDLGDYDNAILSELLESLDQQVGTGYTESDMQALLNTVNETLDGVKNTLDTDLIAPLSIGSDVNADVDDKHENFLKNDGETISNSVMLLDPDIRFDVGASNFWEIPELREDMLITELPDNMRTWAGSATRDIDHDGYWFYNWGIDSTSGMDDFSKIFLSFYCWDEYFDNWWYHTDTYMAKVINNKIKYAITPNFSQGGMPKALSLWNLYRSRWLGRYFQEIGCKVMPDMEMLADEEYEDIAISCLPKPLPFAAVQMQNLYGKTRSNADIEDQKLLRDAWQECMIRQTNKMEVENLLVYATENQHEAIQNWFASVLPQVKVHCVQTRMDLLTWSRKENKEKLAKRL